MDLRTLTQRTLPIQRNLTVTVTVTTVLTETLTRTRLPDTVQAVTEQAEEDRTPTLLRATESAVRTARLDILEVVRATSDMVGTLVEATEGTRDLKEAMVVVEEEEERAHMDRPHLLEQLVVNSAVRRVPEELAELEELEEEEQLERNRAQDSLLRLKSPERPSLDPLPLRTSRALGRDTAQRDTNRKSDTSFL